MATTLLRGSPCQTNADLPAVGEVAPDFELIDMTLSEKSLTSFGQTKKLIYCFPSLDTMICEKSTKQLDEISGQFADAEFIAISMDLPFAQQRFFKTHKLNNVSALSLFRTKKFAEDYGVLLIDGMLQGLTARAVFVLDEDNQILHHELVDDITHFPNFDAATQFLKA